MSDQVPTLVCFSHLNWEHVWQRPQQLMSRFAHRCRVIYADPPDLTDAVDQPQLEERPGVAGVRVIRPLFPARLFRPSQEETYRNLWLELLPAVLGQAGARPIMYVFSPLADYLVAAARDQISVAVYDCMDDLASFKDGTAAMREREVRLLDQVDLVFTGGRSMYEARKDRHARVFCFPSGVDVAHYRQQPDLPRAVRDLPHPRLGYFGVLDERIDWDLIRSIAEQRPEWHWLLVGPTAKVDPAELPTAPNIHYFGQQPYEQLPAFLHSFDLATMPFALNAATRFISPTKTLEYLAGGRDVISSSVPDVVSTYTDIVTIADGSDAWIAAIERLLAAPPAERAARLERAQPLLQAGSWDGIVAQMWTLIGEAGAAR